MRHVVKIASATDATALVSVFMGEVITDSMEAANLLNDYFASVYTDEKIGNLPDPVNIFTKTLEESLQNIEFTAAVVQEKLSKMKPNKSSWCRQF